MFPAIVRPENYYGAGPGMMLIVAIILALMSPAAILGGLIGGSLAVEGGNGARRALAILAGIALSIPCSAWGYWYFTGW
jgi:hypothetical protein